MTQRLINKTAIITGGASGIGMEICLRFASEGANLVIVDVNPEALSHVADTIDQMGATYITKTVDVRDESQIQALLGIVVEKFHSVDILVNTAGILGPMSTRIENLTMDEWRTTLDINLIGSCLTMKHTIPVMKKSGGGAIINFSSTAGLNPIDGAAPYCVSKAGILMLTRVAALEYGNDGIRVNAICPDKIDTPMMSAVVTHLEDIGLSNVRETISAGTVLHRFGTAREVASLALFLASEEESSFITGGYVLADGGSMCM